MKIIACIVVSLLIVVVASVISVLLCACVNWRNAYRKLQKENKLLKNENVKLQHDVYKLTYMAKYGKTTKGEKENGKK
jgi:hypothetical protein